MKKKKNKKDPIKINSSSSFTLIKIRIKVIGVGGGGGGIVSEMAKELRGPSFLVVDTDERTFKRLPPNVKGLLFGEEFTKGLGTGMNPEIGAKAFVSVKDKLEKTFENQDLIILVGCLGGGVGSGVLPEIAELVRKKRVLSLGIFTLPFEFEGEAKKRLAEQSLERIKENLSGTVAISNEKIIKVVDKKLPLKKAFSFLNQVLIRSLKELLNIISSPGILNIDFADLRTILEGRGKVIYFSNLQAQGLQRGEEIVKKLFHHPFFVLPPRVQRILLNIAGGDLKLKEVDEIGNLITKLNGRAKIILGISHLPKLNRKIKVTLMVVGEEMEKKKKEKKEKESKSKETPEKLKRKKAKAPKKKLFEEKEEKLKRRRTALEIQKVKEKIEEEEFSQGMELETPAFLRRKIK